MKSEREEEEEEKEEEKEKEKKRSMRSNGSKYDNQDDIGRENMPAGLTGDPPTDKTDRKTDKGKEPMALDGREKKIFNETRRQKKKNEVGGD